MLRLFSHPGFAAYVTMAFLNAFVDLGHKIVIQNTVFKIWDGDVQIVLTSIVNALILLPFVLLYTPTGFVSDRWRKNRVLRTSAWVAVVLTLAITACYYCGWFWPAFAMTFLLAVQAAFYSPAKYGYIRELTGVVDLATANGVVQAVTTVAILAGVFVFSILFEHFLAGRMPADPGDVMRTIAPAGWCLVGAALAEALLSHRLPDGAPGDDALRFDWARYRRGTYLRENFRAVRRHEVIFLSIFGLAVYWALAQVVLAAFPAYAKDTLGETNTVVIQGMLACAGLGTVLGSVVAGRLSRSHIETGLIPIGAFGVAGSLALVPVLDSAWLHGLNFAAIGLLGGLFVIPLNALIQYHAPEHERGRVLAANNFVQNVVMLAFLALAGALAGGLAGARAIFAGLSLVALAGAAYTVWKLPQALARFIAAAVIARKYRLDVVGFEHVPASGGVLMLGNHVSWIDWAILQTACPRQIRFVMERGIYERWYLKWFFDLFGVVPIARSASRESLESVTRLLDAGEVVCLFPEGTISRTGHLVEFKRGYERAAAQAGPATVIVPFYLRGLWGSWFSRSSERLRLARRDGVRRDIVVTFGAPLPIATPAPAVKQRVFELSIASWKRYTETLPGIPAAWLEALKRMDGDMLLADSVTGTLSARRFGAAVLTFARLIERLSPEQNVGILLPAGAAGAIVNMAALLRGRTVVNLNYTATGEAIASALRKAGIRSVWTSERFLKKLAGRGVDFAPLLAGLQVVTVEDLRGRISTGDRLRALAAVTLLPAWLLALWYGRRVHPDDPAAILFSSGSEGEPKGVMLSHRNIVANARQIADVLNTRDGDVVLSALPLFHAFGLTVTTLMPLVEGIPLACHPDPTDAPGIGRTVATYRATILCGTSTFLRLYTRSTRVHPLMFDSLRVVVAGAERLAPDVREAFRLKFGKDVLEGYGATETTPVAAVNLPDQLDTRYWLVQCGQRPGTVGLPLPGTAIRIVDPQTLVELPAGTDGLILIGGVQVMLGYLGDAERTAAAIVELDGGRWYRSGDKGHVDEDGFVTIVDRYSRFAKIGGEMVSLGAVEALARSVLADADIDLVAVNLPDAKKGERIVLLVAAPLDTDALGRTLQAAAGNALMVPADIACIEAVPRLGSGKTDFTAARQLARAMAGAPEPSP